MDDNHHCMLVDRNDPMGDTFEPVFRSRLGAVVAGYYGIATRDDLTPTGALRSTSFPTPIKDGARGSHAEANSAFVRFRHPHCVERWASKQHPGCSQEVCGKAVGGETVGG